MLNASPDARQQLLQNRCLWPREGLRHSPVQAVVLTSAEVDHVAGLLSMRESQPFVLWGTRRVLGLLAENPIFGALNPDFVRRQAFALGEPIELAGSGGPLGLAMTAFAVPGKVPLFLEGRDPQHLSGTAEDTIGLEITTENAKLHFIPGCARMTPELEDRLRGSALVFFDGTLWSDDELVRLGISHKTGQRMGHMSINGGSGTLSAFERIDVRRKIFIHVNTTNPVLEEDSPERAEVVAHGWEVAEDGMRITL